MAAKGVVNNNTVKVGTTAAGLAWVAVYLWHTSADPMEPEIFGAAVSAVTAALAGLGRFALYAITERGGPVKS